MAFASLVIMASVPLLGGSLPKLTSVRLQHAWLVVLALALQVVITTLNTGAPHWVLVGVHLISYALAAAALWLNRKLPGLLLIGGGAMLNGVVITLNGGTLPASAHALRAAGHAVDAKSFENSGVLAHPILPWLGDVVATPAWLPFRNVISIGDVTILLGTLVLAHSVCRRTGAHRRGSFTALPAAVAPEQQLQPAA